MGVHHFLGNLYLNSTTVLFDVFYMFKSSVFPYSGKKRYTSCSSLSKRDEHTRIRSLLAYELFINLRV